MRAHYTSGATAVNAILDIIHLSAQVLTRMVLCYHSRLAAGEVTLRCEGEKEAVAHVTATYSIPPGQR